MLKELIVITIVLRKRCIMTKRKWSKILVAALVLTMSVWTLAGCGSSGEEETDGSDGTYSASEMSSDMSMAGEVQAFYDAVDMDYALDQTKKLAYSWEEFGEYMGWRSAGSEAEHKCADYLAEQMQKLGLEDVEKVGTSCDLFQFNNSSLKIEGSKVDFKGGTMEDVEAGTNGPASYQVDGTNGDLTAEIVDCGTGFEADYEGKDVEGKIALVLVDQANEAWIDGYMYEANSHGAAALLTYSAINEDGSGYGQAGTDTTNVQDVCAGNVLPSAAISNDQAQKILKAMKNGHNMATLNIDANLELDAGTTYNVIGKIPGKNHDQKIIVSGHYDKYWYGFQDDCAAIGLVLSVAKAMKDSGYEPENDIYFVCHGAEEWGVSDSMYDWTTGAWGMVNEHNMAEGCIAMINFELPAVDLENNNRIASVPEFNGLVADIFDSGLLITTGDRKYDKESPLVTTMEDGITYREYGTPYVLNGFEGESFMCNNYHTHKDNEDTYNADVFQTNIDFAGAYAIYIDTLPALPLDIAASANMLQEDFDADIAKEAGVDTEEYLATVKDLKKAGKALNQQIAQCNEDYEKAAAEEDEAAMASLREEGAALNEKSLAAFKKVNESFLKVTDFTADYGHTPENSNVKVLDGIIAGLENGEVWAEDEESGAGDCAWQLNGVLEYNYMIFGMDTGNREMEAHSMDYYADMNQAQWGWNHMFTITDTGEASYELLRAETIEDIEDVDAMIDVYKEAKAATLDAVAELSAQEVKDMKSIIEILK